MTASEKSSLFSLEVAVNTVFIRRAVVCRVPLVAFRLLDYPTIGISLLSDEELKTIKDSARENPDAAERTYQITRLQHSTGTYMFSQGKSCLLKRRLSELHDNLSSVPLYVMLLDVLPEPPKLVASCSVSLDRMMKQIVRDVSVNGIEVPSTQGEKDVFSLYNLMGDKVGETELGIRITSLGVAMLQHVSGVSEPGTRSALDEEILRKRKPTVMQSKKPVPSAPKSDHIKEHDVKLITQMEADENKENKNRKLKVDKVILPPDHSAATQTALIEKISQGVQFPLEKHEKFTSTENVFCPPGLYYEKNSDSKHKSQQKRHISYHISQETHYDEYTTNESCSEGGDKLIVPRTMVDHTPGKHKEIVPKPSIQMANSSGQENDGVSTTLKDFPLLKALVEEVSRLGLQERREVAATQPERDIKIPNDEMRKDEKPSVKKVRPISAGKKSAKKQPERKGPLRFGLTNTMRLRMAINKPDKHKQEEFYPAPVKRTPKSTKPPSLGQTFIKSYPSSGKKRIKMVTTACGPDESMYRQAYMNSFPYNMQPHTVFLGRMPGYEEATDQDIPSLPHLTSESKYENGIDAKDQDAGTDIEDLVIVKEMGTPRAHSRQSQRSIEIHLPTASTQFTLGRDDNEGEWESTFSDKEKIEEMRRAKKKTKKMKETTKHGFYTVDSDAKDISSEGSIDFDHGGKLQDHQKKDAESRDQNLSDFSESDRYRYSDDFEDDKTWSANRTPSALTPVNISQVIHEVDEEGEDDDADHLAPLPSKSMDSTLTTTRTSDFTESSGNENILHFNQLQSASAQKIPSSDDGFDSSSLSKGTSSIVTTLMTTTPRKMKVGTSIPEPIPSDSPVIQSFNTEASSSSEFPDPRRKHGLASKAPKKKKKSTNKEVHLPKGIKDYPTSTNKVSQKSDVKPKPSRMTPSPPSTRRISPLSSPESSRERLRRYYHHPGRRTRTSSSGTLSPDMEKPRSPVRRSDSVSSYQPSDMSEMSNIKLSEDLDNLSDILSEEQDSQLSRSSLISKDEMPSDGPKTYFGTPKLHPNTKLGYTT